MKMRLSDAIALGRTLQEGGDGFEFCDCAAGMGMAAVGIPRGKRCARKAVALWPWLEAGASILDWPIVQISSKYFDVVKGERTLDQLIDWVRANEPSEVHAEEKTITELAPSLVTQG